MAKSKREIDKEIMFNKIMPSSPAGDLDNAKKLPSAVTEPEKTAARLFGADSGVNLQKNEVPILVNIMEYLVIEKLDAAFSKFNCCKCDKCKKDVAAIALNKLKPKYMVLSSDRIPEEVARQNNVEVSTALIQGILQVRSKPRH